MIFFIINLIFFILTICQKRETFFKISTKNGIKNKKKKVEDKIKIA